MWSLNFLSCPSGVSQAGDTFFVSRQRKYQMFIKDVNKKSWYGFPLNDKQIATTCTYAQSLAHASQ
jgi:hypothetical protein